MSGFDWLALAEFSAIGLLSGGLLALVALGFVLIYKATETVSFVQGDLQTKGNNYVEGPLCAGKRLQLGPDSQVGDKECPSSVSAWTIALHASVRVYGSMAAVRSGQVVL